MIISFYLYFKSFFFINTTFPAPRRSGAGFPSWGKQERGSAEENIKYHIVNALRNLSINLFTYSN
jgi:hypothetical protein